MNWLGGATTLRVVPGPSPQSRGPAYSISAIYFLLGRFPIVRLCRFSECLTASTTWILRPTSSNTGVDTSIEVAPCHRGSSAPDHTSRRWSAKTCIAPLDTAPLDTALFDTTLAGGAPARRRTRRLFTLP